MSKLLATAITGVVLLGGGLLPAQAADPYEPPVIDYIPPEPVAFGGWYLRGHIGMSNQSVGSLYNVLFEAPGVLDHVVLDKNFEAGPTFGFGAGYRVNDYLRVDGLVEYRGETGFHGLDSWHDGVNPRFNNYSAKKSEWLLMANAYADLGNFNGIVPYVGAGVGASRVTIHSFRDEGIDPFGAPTLAYGDASSKWNFAWALHAGVGFEVSENTTIDLGYSYLDLGKGRSGDLVTHDGINNVNNPMHFRNITSHDLKLGVRYSFN